MAWFYILYSRTLDRYYIGHTSEALAERLRKHLSDHHGWSSRAKDWQVAHFEQYPDKAMAYRREREVKGWKSRDRIRSLIRGAARECIVPIVGTGDRIAIQPIKLRSSAPPLYIWPPFHHASSVDHPLSLWSCIPDRLRSNS